MRRGAACRALLGDHPIMLVTTRARQAAPLRLLLHRKSEHLDPIKEPLDAINELRELEDKTEG